MTEAVDDDIPPVCASISDTIFDPAAFLNKTIVVEGRCVMLDRELKRMDISDAGAKLICRLDQVDTSDVAKLSEASVVRVTGMIKKEQRRTFILAQSVAHV